MSNNSHPQQKEAPNILEQAQKMPFFLSVVLYSVAIVCVLSIVVLVVTVASHLTQFKALSSFFQSNMFASRIDWYVYISLTFFSLSLFSVIQMIRKKKHGFILFLVLGFSLIGFILFQQPIDKANLILGGSIVLMVLLHSKWFFKKHVKKGEDNP